MDSRDKGRLLESTRLGIRDESRMRSLRLDHQDHGNGTAGTRKSEEGQVRGGRRVWQVAQKARGPMRMRFV